MSKRILFVVGLLLSLLVASPTLVAAQASTEPDVAEIGQLVEDTDVTSLIAGLETPPRARTLPDGFSEAEFVDISTAKGAASADCMYDASTVNVEGAAGYVLTADPDVLTYAYTCASINYLAFDAKDMGRDPLGDFKEGVESGLDESGSVTDITVAGEDAILITYSLEQNGAFVVVQTIAIPVGNVFVVALVSVGDSAEVDAADVEQLANDLTVAGIEHLGTVAEDAQ